jgi:aminomethyltransferase
VAVNCDLPAATCNLIHNRPVPFPTPLHNRTRAACTTLNYRDWAGYYAVSAYEANHEHEYYAIRHGAGLLDISPLFKYTITGRDAAAFIDRVITRAASRLEAGQVIYTPWCDEWGCVIDDGLVARLGDERFRWTAAAPNLRWFVSNAIGLDVKIDDVSERTAAVALQGPTSAAILREVCDIDVEQLKYFHVAAGKLGGSAVEISRTGYTGDLGYEIWMDAADACDVWDVLVDKGRAFGLKPAGLLSLDAVRIEAGLPLTDVDFFGVRKAMSERQRYSPLEMGMERFVDFGKERFIGRAALGDERTRGVRRQIVGVTIDWPAIERLHDAAELPAMAGPNPSRTAVPIFDRARQAGLMTSSTWSPILKKMIGLATVDASCAKTGTRLEVEHTIDAVRHRVGATVTATPFFNPKRKTQTPP